MASKLKTFYDNISPEKIVSKESIGTLLNLYISSLDKLQVFLEDPTKLIDADFLTTEIEKTNNHRLEDLKKELFKIFLEEVYTTFNELEKSEEIYLKFKNIYESLNSDIGDFKIEANIGDSIDSQYINASTAYKSKKGTKSGFLYIYDIINKTNLQLINSDIFFNIIEGGEYNPFEYEIETSLYEEVFTNTVVPLAHPVGFEYFLTRLESPFFEDYFGLNEERVIESAVMNCTVFNEGIISEDLLEEGSYGKFRFFEEKGEELRLDYLPLNGADGEEGLRILKESDGRIYILNRQLSIPVSFLGTLDENSLLYDDRYEDARDSNSRESKYLEISDLRLVDNYNGILQINRVDRTLMGEVFSVIDSIDFTEYTIINKDYINVEFKIRNGIEDKWYYSTLELNNKVVSSDVKFFEPKHFSREDIFNASLNYDGEILIDKVYGCSIVHEIGYSYNVTTTDISSYVSGKRDDEGSEHTIETTNYYGNDFEDIILDPCTIDSENSWNIGDDLYIGDCLFIDNKGKAIDSPDDYYRYNWSEGYETFEMGVYRYNEGTSTWELLADNNISSFI